MVPWCPTLMQLSPQLSQVSCMIQLLSWQLYVDHLLHETMSIQDRAHVQFTIPESMGLSKGPTTHIHCVYGVVLSVYPRRLSYHHFCLTVWVNWHSGHSLDTWSLVLAYMKDKDSSLVCFHQRSCYLEKLVTVQAELPLNDLKVFVAISTGIFVGMYHLLSSIPTSSLNFVFRLWRWNGMNIEQITVFPFSLKGSWDQHTSSSKQWTWRLASMLESQL